MIYVYCHFVIFSWDRIVPETFVQKNSAENRALMKRLAVVARNV